MPWDLYRSGNKENNLFTNNRYYNLVHYRITEKRENTVTSTVLSTE
jgi:hypothetical protein